jgi:hypothetical protein
MRALKVDRRPADEALAYLRKGDPVSAAVVSGGDWEVVSLSG